jgi:hypothetical protein
LAYVLWVPGEPNDVDGSEDNQENCAFLTDSGEWSDRGCSEAHDALCER